MTSMTGPSSTLPLAFNAVIVHLLPVPETWRGGSTKPSDQRAYLDLREREREREMVHKDGE